MAIFGVHDLGLELVVADILAFPRQLVTLLVGEHRLGLALVVAIEIVERQAELVVFVLGQVTEGGGVIDLLDEFRHRRRGRLQQIGVGLHPLQYHLQIRIEDSLDQIPEEAHEVHVLDEFAGQLPGLLDPDVAVPGVVDQIAGFLRPASAGHAGGQRSAVVALRHQPVVLGLVHVAVELHLLG